VPLEPPVNDLHLVAGITNNQDESVKVRTTWSQTFTGTRP